jgi:hypothetical protein
MKCGELARGPKAEIDQTMALLNFTATMAVWLAVRPLTPATL